MGSHAHHKCVRPHQDQRNCGLGAVDVSEKRWYQKEPEKMLRTLATVTLPLHTKQAPAQPQEGASLGPVPVVQTLTPRDAAPWPL